MSNLSRKQFDRAIREAEQVRMGRDRGYLLSGGYYGFYGSGYGYGNGLTVTGSGDQGSGSSGGDSGDSGGSGGDGGGE
jgi:hypothetical protein